MCKTHNHQWEICISNQKPPYIPMDPYLQQSCQRHIQEYISWNRSRHKPGKTTTGMMLLSLLIVQGNNILPKWYEETTGLYFDYRSRGWWPSHNILTHLQSFLFMGGGTRLDIIAHMLMGCHACFAWGYHLFCVSFLGTNYKNVLQQVLCKLWFIYYLSSSKSFEKCFFESFLYLF